MKESIGGSLLLNLVIIFIGLVTVFFVSILSYSKAYRVKNRIIEIIEKHEKYDSNVSLTVNPDLKNMGYNASNPTRCDNIRERLITEKYDESILSENKNNNYNYCVYKVDNNAMNGYYYVVVTFIRFEVPIIGDVLTFPVYGETKILGKEYNYE